jgi:hypothetical protein
MLRKSHPRFSRVEIALFVIPLLLPVAVKVASVIREESKGRYLVWNHGTPSWRKSTWCINGAKQIALGFKQYMQDQP